VTVHALSDRLGPYLDGELAESQARRVEAHLAACSRCRAELQEISTLSALLVEGAGPGLQVPTERFVAQVTQHLPSRPVWPVWRQALELGWQAAPWTILGGWAFAQAVLLVSGVIVTAFAMIPEIGDAIGWAPSAPGSGWPSQLTGLLVRAGLAAAAGGATDVFGVVAAWGWLPLVNLALLALVTLAYWSWLASWWARRCARTAVNGSG
jgi:anti-sigma factor RsiW